VTTDARAKEVTRLLKRGLNHYALGDVPAAIASWEEARALDPENQALHDYLEAAYDEVGTQDSSTRVARTPARDDDSTPLSSSLAPRAPSRTPVAPPSRTPARVPTPAAGRPTPEPPKPPSRPAPRRAAADATQDTDTQISRALTAYKSGQLRDALRELQKLADAEPERLDVQGYLQLVRSDLAKASAQEIGDKGRVVSLQVTPEQLMKLRLAPDEGFLLSQVDGTVSIADLIALSSSDRVRTLDILARFLREGIIA
jgi:tetratricopeptide (TPR) repeat protein